LLSFCGVDIPGKYAVPDGSGGYTVTLEGNFWPTIQDGCQNPHSASNGTNKNAYNVPYSAIVTSFYIH
jgi:hypothetical protein